MCVSPLVTVSSAPVAGLVPTVRLTVPFTAEHTWLVAQAIVGLVPAAAPAATVAAVLPPNALPVTPPELAATACVLVLVELTVLLVAMAADPLGTR